MSAKSFADIASLRAGRHKGCPRCGAPKNAGVIGVTAQKLGEKGSIASGGRLASRSVSLCEPCTVDGYRALVAALENFAAGGAA